jgi:hypothetical protein
MMARLKCFEYIHMPLTLFPEWIQIQYNMKELAYNGYIHLEMRPAVWGLPQAGILANERLRQKLALFGYFKSMNTPGLWYHESCPISSTLMVDDFGVKYKNKDDINHLVASIKTMYTLTKDRSGDLYCGIELAWDYVNRTVDISMPGYIKKKISEYIHIQFKCTQTCPYLAGTKAIWDRSTSSPSNQHFPPPQQKRHT